MANDSTEAHGFTHMPSCDDENSQEDAALLDSNVDIDEIVDSLASLVESLLAEHGDGDKRLSRCLDALREKS